MGKAVIIGAGAIGCEMAEALSDLWGVETSLVELAPQVLPGLLDPGLARMVQKHLEDKEIGLHFNEQVREIRETPDGEHALEVVTGSRILPADLVITAVGAVPNSQLAQDAGLLVSPQGGIVVNRRLQTSDPHIYAGGDCIDNHHLLTGQPVYFPSGSLANRQGRVIGTNLAGGSATFKGIVGSFALKIFDLAVAGTGLSLEQARQAGFDAVDALVIQADRAHFYPTQDLMYLQLVVDRKTRRLLGAQGLSHNGDALVGRINSIAALLPFKATLEDLSNLEVAYAPPFAAALDIVNAVANTAENTLDGYNKNMDVAEFERCFLTEKADRRHLPGRAGGAQRRALRGPLRGALAQYPPGDPEEALRRNPPGQTPPGGVQLRGAFLRGPAPTGDRRPVQRRQRRRRRGGPEKIGVIGLDRTRR